MVIFAIVFNHRVEICFRGHFDQPFFSMVSNSSCVRQVPILLFGVVAVPEQILVCMEYAASNNKK
jgi:hypothetical protein